MRTWGFVAASFLVISCGGGGGGGSPDAAPDDPDAEIPDAEHVIDELSWYAVTVTVSGLSGTLELELNGTDELTFTADGTMTFNDLVGDTEEYTVTVTAEPTTQNCAVTGGTGTITGADVAVTVTCAAKAWSFPASSDGINPFGGEVYEPHVGIDDAGYAVVIYHADDGTTACGGDPCRRIFASERTDGTWAHPTSASQGFSLAGYGTATSDVAVADNGDAVVVYDITTGGSPSHTLLRSDRRGGTWTHATSTTDTFSFPVSFAQNAIPRLTPTGGGLILWSQVDGTRDQIYASEYTGSAWVDPTDVTDNYGFDASAAYQFDGGIADNGDLVIVWAQSGSGNEQVYVSERRGVVETNPGTINDHVSIAGTDAVSVELEVNGPGEAVLAWRQNDGTTACSGQSCSRIYVGTIAAGSRTLPSSLTNDSTTFAGSHAFDYRVAIDDAGNIIVVWSQSDGTAVRLYRAERRGGVWTGPASAEATVSASDTDVSTFDVAMDDNGQAIIAWIQSDGSTACGGGACARVYLSQYRGGAWSDPDDLADDAVSPGGFHADHLRVAMSDGGDAVLTWGSYADDETNHAIYIATYQ